MRDGFVVGVANPKVIVFFAAILPQFVDQGGAPAGVQMAVLGLVFVAIALVSDSTWGMVSGTARQWLGGRAHRMERLTAFGGTIMIGLGLRLALTGRKDCDVGRQVGCATLQLEAASSKVPSVTDVNRTLNALKSPGTAKVL